MVQLSNYFGQDLFILSGTGVASILVFQREACKLLELIVDDEDDVNASVAKSCHRSYHPNLE